MIWIGQLRALFMRKLFLGAWVILSLSICQAQTPLPTQEQDSFGDIAALGQKIALSERKIQALQLQNNLAAIEEQQMLGHFPFKVKYIEGFNDVLYAVLVDDQGALYHVGPSEVFADHYRVSLIRPTAVGVDDLSTQRFYTVPFLLGTSGPAMIEDFSQAETNAPVASANKVPTSSSKV